MRIVDTGVPRSGTQMAGHLDCSLFGDVSGDDLVAVDPHPHLLVDQGVGNRIRHPTETDL